MKNGAHQSKRIMTSIEAIAVVEHLEEHHAEEAKLLDELLDFYYDNPGGAPFKKIYEFIEKLNLPNGSNVQNGDKANYIYYGEQYFSLICFS